MKTKGKSKMDPKDRLQKTQTLLIDQSRHAEEDAGAGEMVKEEAMSSKAELEEEANYGNVARGSDISAAGSPEYNQAPQIVR